MKEDQFRAAYKKAVDSMKPSETMRQQLEQRIGQSASHTSQRQERRRPRKSAYIAASIVLAAGIGLAAPSVWQQLGGTSAPGIGQTQSGAKPAPGASDTGATAPGAVVIPKLELPSSKGGAAMDMVGLVVYQGNVYTQAAIRIDATDARALRGDKLGRTTGGIHELSGKEAYTELASTIGEADIYSVKGYDTGFLLMSYTEQEGQVFAELYEHTNGITVASGADLLGQLHLEGRVTSAQWESFDSWNNARQQYAPLAVDSKLDDFLDALLSAKPLKAQPLLEEGIYDSEDRKLIYLTLADHTRVELVLFAQGLVRYGNAPVFFQVESDAFQTFWSSVHE